MSLFGRLYAGGYDRMMARAEKKSDTAAHRRALVAGAKGGGFESGAGTGRNLREHETATRVVAVEPEPDMRARAERRAARAKVPVEVVDGDAMALPFPDATFDTAVMSLVLCTISDPGRALAEARRVLRPGGALQRVWSPDSEYLALFYDKTVEIWLAPEGQRLLERRLGTVRAVAWADTDNRLAIAGGGDSNEEGYQQYRGYVHIFDMSRVERTHKLLMGASRNVASAVAWRHDGQAIAAGNTVGEIASWDLSSGAQQFVGQLHTGQVNALDWTPDGRRVASVGQDGVLKILDPVSGDELLAPWRSPDALTAVRWTGDGAGLAIGGSDGRVKFWDATRASGLHEQGQGGWLAQLHSHRARQYYATKNLNAALKELARCEELEPANSEYKVKVSLRDATNPAKRCLARARRSILVDGSTAMELPSSSFASARLARRRRATRPLCHVRSSIRPAT